MLLHYVIVFLHKNLIGNVDSNNNINDNGGRGCSSTQHSWKFCDWHPDTCRHKLQKKPKNVVIQQYWHLRHKDKHQISKRRLKCNKNVFYDFLRTGFPSFFVSSSSHQKVFKLKTRKGISFNASFWFSHHELKRAKQMDQRIIEKQTVSIFNLRLFT